MSRNIFLVVLLLLIIIGVLFIKRGNQLLIKNSVQPSSSSANTASQKSWKDYVKQVLRNRADLTITSGTLFLQLTPIDTNTWHIVIKPSNNTKPDTTIVSKKMNLDIHQPATGYSAPLPSNVTLDTTLSNSQLEAVLNSLPDSK